MLLSEDLQDVWAPIFQNVLYELTAQHDRHGRGHFGFRRPVYESFGLVLNWVSFRFRTRLHAHVCVWKSPRVRAKHRISS